MKLYTQLKLQRAGLMARKCLHSYVCVFNLVLLFSFSNLNSQAHQVQYIQSFIATTFPFQGKYRWWKSTAKNDMCFKCSQWLDCQFSGWRLCLRVSLEQSLLGSDTFLVCIFSHLQQKHVNCLFCYPHS